MLALLGMMLFQLSGNLISDYHDYTHHVDKPGEESVQILTSGLFTKKEVLCYGITLLTVACAIGIVIFLRSGWITLPIGIVGILLSVFYFWLKYHALGDLDILLEYAVLPMLGISYVVSSAPGVAGALYWPVLLPAALVGPVTVAILHANNARDIPSDDVSGIKTFAMLIGLKASQWVYGIETLGPHLVILAAIMLGWLPWTAAIALLSLPAATKLNKEVASLMHSQQPFSAIDQKTAALQMKFSLLLAAGLAIAAIIA